MKRGLCFFTFVYMNFVFGDAFFGSKVLDVNAYYKKNVIQGAAKIDDDFWLFVQDPDQSEGKEKLSVSILDNNGILQKSFNFDPYLRLNDMSCPESTVDASGKRINVCGSHGQSVYIKSLSNSSKSVFLENANYNGMIEFELNGVSSLEYKRKIIFTSYGRTMSVSAFAVHEGSGRIAILRKYAYDYYVEVFKIPNLKQSSKDEVIELGAALARFQVQEKEIRPGNNQGIALSDNSVYLMTGHLNVNMPKYIFRFPISGSLSPRPSSFKHRIVDQLEETLNSATAPKSKISHDSTDIEIDCLAHEQDTGCEFNYYEPEALYFSDGKIYYSIVTRPSKEEKLKVMYSLKEEDMKYADLNLDLGGVQSSVRELRKSSALDICKKAASESKLSVKCQWEDNELFSRPALGNYQSFSTSSLLQTFVADVSEEWARADCLDKAQRLGRAELKCIWSTGSQSKELLDLRPLRIYLDGSSVITKSFNKLSEEKAKKECMFQHSKYYFESDIRCLWGSAELLSKNKLTTYHSVSSGIGQSSTFKCPKNSSIFRVKAACNLEQLKIREDFYSLVKENTLSVYRKAFTKASKCAIGDVEASSSETLDLSSILGKNEVSYYCFDKDKKSAGECLIRADFVCRAIASP